MTLVSPFFFFQLFCPLPSPVTDSNSRRTLENLSNIRHSGHDCFGGNPSINFFLNSLGFLMGLLKVGKSQNQIILFSILTESKQKSSRVQVFCKDHKNWRKSPTCFDVTEETSWMWKVFFQTLWPSHNMLTLSYYSKLLGMIGFHSFFGRIENKIICQGNFLTFRDN